MDFENSFGSDVILFNGHPVLNNILETNIQKSSIHGYGLFTLVMRQKMNV